MTKRTVRATALGHTLGKFEVRKSQATGEALYEIAWCTRCGDAGFAGAFHEEDDVNPAIQHRCAGKGARAGL